MEQEFAESLAFMIWPDLYLADVPSVSSGLRDGRALSFSDRLVILYAPRSADGAEHYEDAVALADLARDETAARKLAGWLALREGGASGVERYGSGWSVWSTREDGKVLEVAPFGYQLYDSMEGYLEGGPCVAALRTS